MLRPQVEPGRMDLAHFAAGVALDAFDVLPGQRVCVRVARLADVIEENLHPVTTTVSRTAGKPVARALLPAGSRLPVCGSRVAGPFRTFRTSRPSSSHVHYPPA